jgi:hypothetical protein
MISLCFEKLEKKEGGVKDLRRDIIIKGCKWSGM